MAISEFEKIVKQRISNGQYIKYQFSMRLEKENWRFGSGYCGFCGTSRCRFSGLRYIIDTLKQTVPIWKKEIFEDGEVWVAAHP
jgi:molybdopterin synthase catalytic subunit